VGRLRRLTWPLHVRGIISTFRAFSTLRLGDENLKVQSTVEKSGFHRISLSTMISSMREGDGEANKKED
jgi:hypothetical protein